jgi:hypothetical protein
MFLRSPARSRFLGVGLHQKKRLFIARRLLLDGTVPCRVETVKKNGAFALRGAHVMSVFDLGALRPCPACALVGATADPFQLARPGVCALPPAALSGVPWSRPPALAFATGFYLCFYVFVSFLFVCCS